MRGISTCCHNKHVSKCTYAVVCGVKWKKDRKQICASNIRKKMHSSLAHPSGPQKYARSKIDLFVFKWPQSKQAQGRCRAQLCWDTETDYCLQHGCYCCCICFPLIHLFLLRKYHLLWSIWENYLGKTFFFCFSLRWSYGEDVTRYGIPLCNITCYTASFSLFTLSVSLFLSSLALCYLLTTFS